jgi:3-hydroxybutyryl-CoA dehydratase
VNLKLKDLNVGTSLPESKRRVTQEHINLYAEASKDFNPIHLDPEFARQAGLDGTIAHGMLILAYLSEYMTGNFGQAWFTGGSLNARFKAPARPDDTIAVSGKVTGVQKENGTILIDCDVLCSNQRDEPVIICEAKVRLKTDEDSS